jgi:hypothetical protein
MIKTVIALNIATNLDVELVSPRLLAVVAGESQPQSVSEELEGLEGRAREGQRQRLAIAASDPRAFFVFVKYHCIRDTLRAAACIELYQ